MRLPERFTGLTSGKCTERSSAEGEKSTDLAMSQKCQELTSRAVLRPSDSSSALLLARLNSLLSRKNFHLWLQKFPVPLRREFGCKPLKAAVPCACAISPSPLLSPVDHVAQPLKLLVELGLQMSQFNRMPAHSNWLKDSEHVKMQLVGASKESSILQFSADTVTPTSEIGFPRRNGLGC